MTRRFERTMGSIALLPWAAVLSLPLTVASCGGTVETQNDAGTTTETTTSGTGSTDTTSTSSTSGSTTSGSTTTLPQTTSDKVDLVLLIDNSRSMADKQAILAASVPDLVRGLVNPKCVDPAAPDDATKWSVPAGPLDPCPPALVREFNPIIDIHVGVITTSIGGHASDSCPNTDTNGCPGGATNTSNNDKGHLVTRVDPCQSGGVATYQGKGFLAWDPASQAMPPGETNLGSINVDPNTGAVTTATPGLVPTIKDLVVGTGQIGCGYEAQLESWYRFLVDPEPYETIVINPSTHRAEPMGLDQVLLQQRRDFLRSSSLLLIVGLTDENDCSTKEYGQFFFANQLRDPANPNKTFHLPPARSECATNPADTCCRSCGQDQTGCPNDPACASGPLTDANDHVTLRCFEQKRRFGIDFMYPIDRYVTGLTSPLVPNRTGEMVPNPIFTDLNPGDADSKVRDASLVFISYIAGVPWQLLARDPKDLAKGLKSPGELTKPDSNGKTAWDYIVGDPEAYKAPLDPHMVESSSPRTGTSPVTGDSLAPPSSAAGPGPNPINGREHTPGLNNGIPDDLEYACIFPIPAPRDCSAVIGVCDCSQALNDSPLCDPNPDDGGARTLQVRAKAYPSIRELALIKAMGAHGIPGSVCPAEIKDIASPNYGYRPAFQSILASLKPALE